MAVTWPEHVCGTMPYVNFHNQPDAKYETCAICGRITKFAWKGDALAAVVRGAPQGFVKQVTHDFAVKKAREYYGELTEAREALRLAKTLHSYNQGSLTWREKIDAWLVLPAVIAALTETP